MPKSIVFGANGYIGKHLTKKLQEQNHDVYAYGIVENPLVELPNYKKLDLRNKTDVQNIDFDVDYIFFFAGLIGTLDGFDRYEEYFEVNVLGLSYVLDTIKNKVKKPHIIFPSTRLVYEGQENIMLKEEDRKYPKTIYAQNKISCENLLGVYANFFGIKYTVFRICVVYGNLFEGAYSYGTIGFFLSKASKGENITLYGEGEPKRTFTHVSDIVDIIYNAAGDSKFENQTINIGSTDNGSLRFVAEKIARKYNVELDYIEWPEEARKLESGDTMFDDSRLQTISPYEYAYNLENWIDNLN